MAAARAGGIMLAPDQPRGVSPARVVTILLLVHFVYALDRTAPVIIAEEIKREFGLSDAQLGLYTGLVFGLSFGVVGLLIGPMIDRLNRSRLLAGMLFVWSALTALAAATVSFWQLLTLRMFIGAAESGGSPTILSILSDVVAPTRRGTAIGIYKLGAPMGYAAASFGCAYIAAEYGWRHALLIAGLPGIFLSLAVLRWIPEPERGKLDSQHVSRATAYSLKEIWLLVLNGAGIFPFILGFGIYCIANLAMQAFTIPFLMRVHDVSLRDAGMYFGAASVFGAVSPLVLGIINDRLVRRGVAWSAHFASLLTVLTLAGGWLMLLASSTGTSIAGLFIWMALMSGITAVIFAAVVTITPPRARGTILAVLLVASMAIGSGLGPVLLGVTSDLLGGGEAVGPAGVIVLGLNLLAAICFILAGRRLATSERAAIVG